MPVLGAQFASIIPHEIQRMKESGLVVYDEPLGRILSSACLGNFSTIGEFLQKSWTKGSIHKKPHAPEKYAQKRLPTIARKSGVNGFLYTNKGETVAG
jgi:hypothetical protein